MAAGDRAPPHRTDRPGPAGLGHPSAGRVDRRQPGARLGPRARRPADARQRSRRPAQRPADGRPDGRRPGGGRRAVVVGRRAPGRCCRGRQGAGRHGLHRDRAGLATGGCPPPAAVRRLAAAAAVSTGGLVGLGIVTRSRGGLGPWAGGARHGEHAAVEHHAGGRRLRLDRRPPRLRPRAGHAGSIRPASSARWPRSS